jgi:3-oxoacyl-[acyl-carrier protein] reductase
VAEVIDIWGRLDILVNNAGIGARMPIDDPGYEANWARLLDLLLTAQQRLIRAALPYLRASDAARIVNIASTEALGGTTGNTAYAAAKAGVVGLTRALAVELGREGITVNCICPGPILTEITKMIPEADRDRFARRRTALGRYGRAEEVAHMTLSLCLPAASYVMGVVLPVDGGLTARNA